MTVKMKGPTVVRITREVVHFVKEWRKYQGMNLETLGELSGVSPSMISQLELGKTSYTQNTLERIAAAMKLQPWQLLACGPDESRRLWQVVMNWTGDNEAFAGLPPEGERCLEEMLSNNCEAAAKTARCLYPALAVAELSGT
jgi:transcriptional regulator with XRE-family HTH domain